ncbi:MAG: cytochrome-c peroxidase [SAR86 cluster bacterium]|uniref:Cytochrome-c peroxidase n=1 Tax=SAR86 cluster bacterium TaxID=2030880 RepID=A0A2A4XFN0_9GAMM|nr:MAG: cytochrome-c peroxidase [SAR86 cluster bacterium]
MKDLLLPLLASMTLIAVFGWNYLSIPGVADWSEEELKLIASLSLDALPPLPADPSNFVADDPAAAELGHRLYFDTRLSSNAQVACATCHKPELMFTDGLALAVGVGIGPMHTPSLVGLAYSPWFYWDGRKDSQWAQALAPLEAKHEHATDRVQLLRLISSDTVYRDMYENVFGPLDLPTVLPESGMPEGDLQQQASWNTLDSETQSAVSRFFANLGKAIAAYERKLLPGRTRFDDYVAQMLAGSVDDSALSNSEQDGLKLFIGKGQCVTCHNGPLFTNHEFHNTGVLAVDGRLPSMGRYDGVRISREDSFNCLGEFSDASSAQCIELRFARDANDLVGALKTPTLRNISLTAPYMHSGQMTSLTQVVNHYNEAPSSMLSHNEAKPLGLRVVERSQLEDFLMTLSAPLATEQKWLVAPDY